MTASHASMRDDFEITVAEVDVAVEAALTAGAYGARMTGGGFGGCVLALIDADRGGRGDRGGDRGLRPAWLPGADRVRRGAEPGRHPVVAIDVLSATAAGMTERGHPAHRLNLR